MYTDSLQTRSENGDDEAKLAVVLASCEGNDEQALTEASAWLEVASKSPQNAGAKYYYALWLATGSLEEICMHPGGIKPEPVYYIDVDNLDSFLGLEQGVSPEGNPDEPFNFKKWLKSEQKKMLLAKRSATSAQTSSTEASVSQAGEPISAPTQKTSQSSGVSCSTRRNDRKRQAVELLTESAALGNDRSLVTLMILQSDQESVIYSEEAVKQHIETFKATTNGLGLLRAAEIREDANLYQAAAATGYPEAIFQLGLLYSNDESEQSQIKFLELLTQAASAGHQQALSFAAQLDESDSAADPTNIARLKRIYNLYQRAASSPNPDAHACFQMGNYHYHGISGQEINLRLAFQYWKVGARLGHEDCLVNLASMYYTGTGTKQDFEKAFYSNQNAAVLGSKNAMLNLANMYERGLGVPQSDDQAHYYRSLAEGNVDNGAAVLELLQESSTSTQASSQGGATQPPL
jgi:TPR repeat protein